MVEFFFICIGLWIAAKAGSRGRCRVKLLDQPTTAGCELCQSVLVRGKSLCDRCWYRVEDSCYECGDLDDNHASHCTKNSDRAGRQMAHALMKNLER